MSDLVRHIATMQDAYGTAVHVGVDYGCVVIRCGGAVTFDDALREEFAQIWVRASREADADAERLLAEEAAVPP